MNIPSNIVPQNKVREIQKNTLHIISNALEKSFGPKGSSTAFIKNIDKDGVNIQVEYTKDGHTIIKNIDFLYPIERSIQDILTELTRYIVKEVGDGTTSAIILCKTLFDSYLNAIEKNWTPSNPADFIQTFNNIINDVSDYILKKKRDCTLDDIYNISLISTNNNQYIAGTIKAIYEKFGMDVYIDVGISTEVNNIVKEYDGMTLETGFANPCFINDNNNNTAYIRNPRIYCFEDPIDTPEMLAMLNKILINNIYSRSKSGDYIPTVIFCKYISKDTSSYFENVVKLMAARPGEIPLLIVSDIHQDYLYEDIRNMCGAPTIKKYLNVEMQKADQEKGLAPTEDNIPNFCGYAELVQSDQLKTKVIRPAKMFNEDGTYSDDYNSMVKILETEIVKAQNEGADLTHIAETKRRLNCFKGNMVDFLVGGLTLSDRNNLKASVEDAILNCRSAAANGVGYGANYMALKALRDLYFNKEDMSDDEHLASTMLYEAYYQLTEILYGSYNDDINWVNSTIEASFEAGCPFNLRTSEFDRLVLTSIKADIVILETVGKIMTLMLTCNQYLTQTPMHNKYMLSKDSEEYMD